MNSFSSNQPAERDILPFTTSPAFGSGDSNTTSNAEIRYLDSPLRIQNREPISFDDSSKIFEPSQNDDQSQDLNSLKMNI